MIEKEHAIDMLISNNYPLKFIENVLKKRSLNKMPLNTNKKSWKGTVVIPYQYETSEKIKRILNSYDIRVFLRSMNISRGLLVKLKDPLPKMEVSDCSN